MRSILAAAFAAWSENRAMLGISKDLATFEDCMAENAAASGMKTPEELQKDQIAFWNGDGGEQWAEEQEPLDAMLAPVAEALIAHARIKPGERVLDVGCGNGATTFELAELVGPEGHVAGIDISVPMLSFALAHRAKRDN